MTTSPKNIVFDLGGVLFARDPRTCTPLMVQLFQFIRTDPMPEFWVEYDRGTLPLADVLDELERRSGVPRSQCEECLWESISQQAPIPATERLVGDLKRAGYRLYVLSNMSCEFIEFLRRKEVYRHFDGEVVSCEEHVVKPERAIYERLLERYGLDPAETLFIDDRRTNIAAAEQVGIRGFHFDTRNPDASCEELRMLLL